MQCVLATSFSIPIILGKAIKAKNGGPPPQSYHVPAIEFLQKTEHSSSGDPPKQYGDEGNEKVKISENQTNSNHNCTCIIINDISEHLLDIKKEKDDDDDISCSDENSVKTSENVTDSHDSVKVQTAIKRIYSETG